MATTYVNVKIGSRRAGGSYSVTVTRGNAVSGDVTVAVNTATVTTRAALMEACQAAANDLLSDTVK